MTYNLQFYNALLYLHKIIYMIFAISTLYAIGVFYWAKKYRKVIFK